MDRRRSLRTGFAKLLMLTHKKPLKILLCVPKEMPRNVLDAGPVPI